MPRRPIRVSSEGQSARKMRSVRFISALLKSVVGEDDKPSPLLKSLVDDLGADAEGVELAQDIALMAVDVIDVVANAVESRSVLSLSRDLVKVIGAAIPEIKEDIGRIRD